MYAGKFAQICQTTKDTLRHYDEIGLLKPASISANGYKIYSASQIIDFLAISSLQEAGCSLEEIKRFQKQHDPKMTLQLFANKKVEIEEAAREIEKSDNSSNRQSPLFKCKKNGNLTSRPIQQVGA